MDRGPNGKRGRKHPKIKVEHTKKKKEKNKQTI